MMAGALAVASGMFLALLFGQAGLRKARDLPAAAAMIDGYGLIPFALLRPAAIGLAALELALAALLLAGCVRPNPAGLCAALLLLVFAGAMAVVLARGRPVACGCGADGMVSWRHAGATLLLVTPALLAGHAVPLPPGPVLAQAAFAGALLFMLRSARSALVQPA